MRTRTQACRRSFLPLVFAMLALSACETVNEPDAPARRPVSSSFKTGTSSIGGEGVERPYRAKLVWHTDSIVTALQSGDPLFGGRCSVASNFVEFGHLTGEITHAGLSRGTGNQCVQGTPKTGLTITDGILTFTTANGDVLIVSYARSTISLVNGLFIVDGQFKPDRGNRPFQWCKRRGRTARSGERHPARSARRGTSATRTVRHHRVRSRPRWTVSCNGPNRIWAAGAAFVTSDMTSEKRKADSRG